MPGVVVARILSKLIIQFCSCVNIASKQTASATRLRLLTQVGVSLIYTTNKSRGDIPPPQSRTVSRYGIHKIPGGYSLTRVCCKVVAAGLNDAQVHSIIHILGDSDAEASETNPEFEEWSVKPESRLSSAPDIHISGPDVRSASLPPLDTRLTILSPPRFGTSRG